MKEDFSFPIAFRTWILGAFIGLVTHQLGWYETTDEAATAIGALAAAVYDYVAYHVKKWWIERNEQN